MSDRLGRGGVKETTLDYSVAFGERRGLLERLRSAIAAVLPEPKPEPEPQQLMRGPHPSASTDRSAGPGMDASTDPAAGTDPQRPPAVGQEPNRNTVPEHAPEPRRRSMFDGLRLTRPAPEQDEVGTAQPDPDRTHEAGQEPEPAPEPRPEPRRGSMFDGLRLSIKAQPAQRPEPQSQPERFQQPSGFEHCVDRYARALAAADSLKRDDLPVPEGLKRELREAGRALDQARPGIAGASAFGASP